MEPRLSLFWAQRVSRATRAACRRSSRKPPIYLVHIGATDAIRRPRQRSATQFQSRRTARRRKRPRRWGRCRSGTSPISIPRRRRPRSPAIWHAAAAEARRIKEAYHGKLVGLAADGGVLALRHRGVRALRRADGAARLVRRALLRRQSGRSRARQVLRRRLREAHRHLDRAHLLRAGAEPDRRSGDGAGAEEPAPWPLQAVDRQPAQGEALPARGEARAAVPREGPDVGRAPGTGCSTRRWRRCASRSPASPSRWRSS